MPWSFDISATPRGSYVVKHRSFGKGEGDIKVFAPDKILVATKCGKVGPTHYLPEEKRWLGLAHGEEPVAWAEYVKGERLPEHPFINSSGESRERTSRTERRMPRSPADGRSPQGAIGNSGNEHPFTSPSHSPPAADPPASTTPNRPVLAGDHRPGGEAISSSMAREV